MIGQTHGHYRIMDRLGAGGMGEVYLALDTELDRKVALKVLPPAMAHSEERLKRFRREAKTLASLNHANIVTIYSVESVDGINFLTMELLEGKTLLDHIPLGGYPVKDFFRIGIPLTDALAAAHENGVIHRDLKPGNVIVTHKDVVKVVDFGLAKLTNAEWMSVDNMATTEPLTGEGRILGTVPYMSPEQLRGLPVDHRSDIFSLGIILHQMATGERPFKGSTSAEVQSAILRDTPDPVDQLKREVPHHVARLIGLCLEKDPDSRLQSAKDARNELLVLQQEMSSGDSDVRPLPEPRRQRPRLAPYLAVAVLVVVAAIATWWFASGRSNGGGRRVSVEAQALLDQAELYELRGFTKENLTEAEDRYRRALKIEPANPDIQGRLASLLTDLQWIYPVANQDQEIRLLAESALEQDPENTPAWIALGYLALAREELNAAEEAARKVIGLDPENAFGYTLLGTTLVNADQPDRGLEQLRQGVARAGTDTRPRLSLAWILWQEGRNNEAAVEYEQVLDYAPNSPSALNNLGSIYGQQGRYLEAIPLFRHLLRVTDDAEAAYNLANCYFYLDRLQEAVETYLRVLEIDPENTWAPHGLAESYEKLGEPVQAKLFFEKAVASYDRQLAAGGADAMYLGVRAVCAAKLGRHEEAIDNIHEAEQLAPRHGQLLFNAAQVYALAGDTEISYQYMQRSIQAGYPRQEFEKDLVFADHLHDPEFRQILEAVDSR